MKIFFWQSLWESLQPRELTYFLDIMGEGEGRRQGGYVFIKARGEGEDDQFSSFRNEWVLLKSNFGLTYCDDLFCMLIWVHHSTQVFCLYISVKIFFLDEIKI